jgi:hypothetical protein
MIFKNMPDGWFLTYRLILTLQKILAEKFGTIKTSSYLCIVKKSLRRHRRK